MSQNDQIMQDRKLKKILIQAEYLNFFFSCFIQQIHAVEKELQTLEKALHEPHYSNSELVKLEQDVEALAEQLKSIQDRRNAKSETQDKLALYRQQLTVVKGKKSNLVQRTEQLTQSLETKSQTIEAKKKELASATSSTSQSMPLRGEEFKQYIAELRVKSQQYKQAKAEMQTIQRESQVLERTLELLMQKKEQLQRSNSEKEQRQGVSGYVEKKQKLANLSEAKGSLEDTNEEGVHEFTALVKALTDEIHAQQHQLAPAIQELKALRAKNAELEAKYIAAKKEFEAEVVGLEKMVMDLQQEAQQEMETLASETSLWHTHMASMQILDTTMDHVLQEMKAVTDKSTSDSIQRQCGFKTWQDFLQRKCLEAEAAAKQLQIQHKKVEELQSPNEKQLVLFQALHKVLQMRLEMNQKYINEPKEPKNAEELLSPTEQRLVIS
ncbi:Intraflagellar transport protein 81 [Coelomomyces lativittatus]|nr:Intraflagellar transport protein 81 [Coelomomyces lativittatus]